MKTTIIPVSVLLLFQMLNTFAVNSKYATKKPSTSEIVVNNFIFQDDPLNVPKKEYYPSGKVCKEYILDHGQINGSYKFYSEKGFLVSNLYYVNLMPRGYLRTFFESVQLQSETNFE